MFTSGTTGRPKATEIPPTMFPDAADIAALLDLIALHPLHGLGRHLVVGPLHHTGPLTAARLLTVGNEVTVLGRFDAARLLHVAERDRIATSVMVPTHFARLLALPEEVRKGFDPSSLRSVAQTGASCPVEVKRKMIDWWGPVFVESYGATEVGVVASIDSDEWLERPGSVGRAVEPFEAVVLDDDLRPADVGSPGQLWFRDRTGRGLVYAHTPDGGAPEPPPEPGMFTLGEIGHVDADGFIYITDRVSDMVVSGGVNIYPAEVEQVLADLEGVHDAAGIGVPDADLGERLVVLVVLDDPALTADALLAHCRSRIAHYKCPREIVLVEGLPRTTMGKLDKRALRRSHVGS
jgi:long-chain acyl-CoA synthetase